MKRFIPFIAGLLWFVGAVHAQALPTSIRLGAPSVATDPNNFYGTLGIARYKGWLDEEFRKDNIKVDLVGYRGGAPIVGQALANGQIDFAWQGDMLSLIGKANGIHSRVVLPMDKLANAYLAVAPTSTISSIKDLKGKKVSFAKGNQIELQVIRILARNGLTEADLKTLALDPVTAQAALASGDIDAIFGGWDLLALRDKGQAKIVYTTRGGDASLTSYNALLVNDDFAKKYPQVTERLVKVLVRAAAWASDDANRAELFQIWSKGAGVVKRDYIAEDYEGRPLTDRLSPLFDPLLVAHYKDTQDLLVKLTLLRGTPVDVGQWIDHSYLDQALRELQLEHRWAPLDASGKALPK